MTEQDTIPEKFQNEDGSVNQEALLASYRELERKQSAAPAALTPAAPQPDDTPAGPLKPGDLAPFVTEYVRDGKLSEDSYKKLEARGYAREMVDHTINLETSAYTAAVHQAAGGAEAYDDLAKRAVEVLPAEDVEFYSSQIRSGNPNAAAAAVRALKALMTQYQDPLGGMVHGGTAGAPETGAKPYMNEAELQAAMRKKDPNDRDGRFLYFTDPAYRQEVIARQAAFYARQRAAKR